jgi:TonB family protein
VAGIEFGQGLREKAAEAVGNSRFQPGTLNGAPVAVHTRVAVSFRIADGKPEIAVYEPSEVELQSLLRARMEARRAMGLPPAGRGPMGSQMSADGVKRTPPRVLHSVEAEFSEEARRRKYQGVVTVSLVVNEKGLPTDLKIVNGLDYGLSDQALDAVSQYRFAPATENGKPVPAQISVQVSFKLY